MFGILFMFFLNDIYYDLFSVVSLSKKEVSNKINEINDFTRKLNSLGRDKFGFLRWLLLASLASVIILLTLSMPTSNFINLALLMLFPPIIFLVIYTINSYQNMTFHKESTSMEINEKLFDEIDQNYSVRGGAGRNLCLFCRR